MVVSSHARKKNVNEIKHRKSKYFLIKLKEEKNEKADSDSPFSRGKFYQKKNINKGCGSFGLVTVLIFYKSLCPTPIYM